MDGPLIADVAPPGRRPPRVAVIIPSFNRSGVLPEAIDSVISQTFSDLEIVVVDDGSTDDTALMLHDRFGGEARLRCLRQDNRGPAAARNLGIRHSSSDLVAFLDSDDLWMPEKLRLQVDKLDASPEAALCFCDRVLDARDLSGSRFLGAGFRGDTSLRGMLEKSFPLSTPSVVIRRSVLERVGLFDESLAHVEDWDLWIRVLAEYPITYVDRPLTVVRRQRDSLSGQPALEKWRCMLRLWVKHDALLRRAGCPERLIRGRRAHAHRKIAQALHLRGSHGEARRHYLDWWHCQPWRLRPLFWWACLRRSGSGTDH